MAEEKVADPSIIEVVTHVLHQMYPPDVSRPAYGAQGKAMTGNGNGSIAALETKVVGLEHQFDSFRETAEKQNIAINASIRDLADKLDKRFEAIASDQREAATTGRSNIWVIVGIAVSSIIGLLGVGATFWTLAQAPVTTELARHDLDLRDLHATTENREELKADFEILKAGIVNNSKAIDMKVDQRVQDEVIKRIDDVIYNVRNDVERLKNDIVSRRENESHWDDYQNRINLLSNRLTELQKESGGAGVGEQIKAVQDQLNMLQQKFIAAPERRP